MPHSGEGRRGQGRAGVAGVDVAGLAVQLPPVDFKVHALRLVGAAVGAVGQVGHIARLADHAQLHNGFEQKLGPGALAQKVQRVEHQPQVLGGLHALGHQLHGQLAEVLGQGQGGHVLAQAEKHFDGKGLVDVVCIPPFGKLQAGIAQQARGGIFAVLQILGAAGKGAHHALIFGEDCHQPVALPHRLLLDNQPLGYYLHPAPLLQRGFPAGFSAGYSGYSPPPCLYGQSSPKPVSHPQKVPLPNRAAPFSKKSICGYSPTMTGKDLFLRQALAEIPPPLC